MKETNASIMADVLLFGAAGSIERIEARGQQSLVEGDALPSDMGDMRAVLESAGAVFHGPVPHDPLFEFVTLPAGWRKVALDHSMWSELRDEQDRKRARIFYKAAPYDRRARIYAEEPTP